MNNNSIKKIITAGILIVLFIIALRVALSVAGMLLRTILPLAILSLAVYLVYKVYIKGKN